MTTYEEARTIFDAAMSASSSNGDGTTAATVDDEWTPQDIVSIARAIADGTREREVPTLLAVDGAAPLIYRGRIHSIFGAPGGGKTWVALAAIAERVQAGEPVLFIDWEDSPDGTAARLLDLGVEVDDLVHLDYISPSTALSLGIGTLIEFAETRSWTLVVIDSAGEAMAAAGIDPNADGQVATWMTVAKSLTTIASMPAVLILDHIPKNTGDTPTGFAIGSQRKLAAITGAAYRCDTLVEPAIGKAGKLKLVVAKDRLGNRSKGSTATEVHFEPQDDIGALRLTFRISDAQAAHERGEKFRPTVLMERVSRWIELNPGASLRMVKEEVSGRNEGIVLALSVLVEEGFVTVEIGPKQSKLHTVVKPYREDDMEFDPDRGPCGPTVAPPWPRATVDDRGPVAPPPSKGATGQGPHEDHAQSTSVAPSPDELF